MSFKTKAQCADSFFSFAPRGQSAIKITQRNMEYPTFLRGTCLIVCRDSVVSLGKGGNITLFLLF